MLRIARAYLLWKWDLESGRRDQRGTQRSAARCPTAFPPQAVVRGGCDPDPEPGRTAWFEPFHAHVQSLGRFERPKSSSKKPLGSGLDPPWAVVATPVLSRSPLWRRRGRGIGGRPSRGRPPTGTVC